MHPALQTMLTETVSHAVATGLDDYGQPTYASPVARPARVEYKQRRIRNAQGAEVISRCRVFLAASPPISVQDQLVLPDGTAPQIQVAYEVRDVDGSVHHQEIML